MYSAFPTSFSTNNTHRVVLFSPDCKVPDYKRIPDLGADALAALREALHLVPSLSPDMARDLSDEIVTLQGSLGRREIFNDTTLAEMAHCVARLESLDPDDVAHRLADNLRQAMAHATRGADLIAAHREFTQLRWNCA